MRVEVERCECGQHWVGLMAERCREVREETGENWCRDPRCVRCFGPDALSYPAGREVAS